MKHQVRALSISIFTFLTVCIAAGVFFASSYHELKVLEQQLQQEQQGY